MTDTQSQPSAKTGSRFNPFKGVSTWEDGIGRLNYIVGVGIIAIGVVSFIVSSVFSLTNWFSTAYFVLFGLMVISAQAKFEFIENNFLFLQKPFGRGIFDVYVATLCLSYIDADGKSTNIIVTILCWAGFVCLTLIGLYYIYQGFRGRQLSKKQAELDASISTIRGI